MLSESAISVKWKNSINSKLTSEIPARRFVKVLTVNLMALRAHLWHVYDLLRRKSCPECEWHHPTSWRMRGMEGKEEEVRQLRRALSASCWPWSSCSGSPEDLLRLRTRARVQSILAGNLRNYWRNAIFIFFQSFISHTQFSSDSHGK